MINQKKNNIWDFFIPAIIIVFLVEVLDLSIAEGVIIALLATAIIGMFKVFVKKKLGAVITIDKPIDNRCRVSVLLWNSALVRSIYSEDYGFEGFGLMTNDGMIVSKPKLINSNSPECFLLCVNSNEPANMMFLRLGDIIAKNYVELEFYISKKSEIKVKKPTTPRIWLIKLPVGIEYPAAEIPETETNSTMENPPNISLLCDRSKLGLQILRYKKIEQIIHWGVSIVLLLVAAFFAGSIAWFVATFNEGYFEIIALMLLTILSLLIMFVPYSKVIPPFVVKYMKSKNMI